MGLNKQWKDKVAAEERLASLLKMLQESLSPYVQFDGKLDLSQHDPTPESGDLLARVLNCYLVLSDDQQDNYFGADTILASQVIIGGNCLIKLWGKVCWLSTPPNHQSYKVGYDPFYAEIELLEHNLQIKKMKFGDYEQTNLDKTYWLDAALDWTHEFEI